MKPGIIVGGRYRCERLLGRGGMGEVHAAIDLRTDRRVAIKFMLGHRLDSEDLRERFEREARVGARIDSPYLVEVHDAGVDPDTDTPYIVMELLDGEDLQHRVDHDGRRPADEVVAHLGQVALALTHMRAQRVVHRDLKPSNLFLQTRRSEPPRIKVLDLGIAKELSGTSGQTTGIAGTPTYMAPEQISSGVISPATDLHALGLIAFTLLAGAPYWSRDPGQEPIALAMKMKDGPQVPASTRARDLGAMLPAGFDAWFERATARRPDRRFGSAIAAVRALAAALGIDAPPWLPDEPEPSDAPTATDLDDDARDDDVRDDDARDGAPVQPSSPTVTLPRRPRPPPVAIAADAPAITTGAPAITTSAPAIAITSPTSDARGRRWLARAGSGLALGGIALAIWFAWPRRAPPLPPLQRPGAVLACPVLAVDGDVASNGWLGAAAAGLACERARVLLGGLPSRTLLPAELLRLPSVPTDDFPIDPYGAPDARAQTLLAAQHRGDAYLDGRVTRTLDGFLVALVLHRPDGTAMDQTTGDGRGLHEAVRAAMAPLIASRAIPTARIPDLVVADYAGAWDVATLLDYLDLAFTLKNNAGQVRTECARFARNHPGASDRDQFGRYECAYTVGEEPPTVVPEGTPATPGAETTRARVVHMARLAPPAAIARLEQLYRTEPSPWAQSSLAATLACLHQHSPNGHPEEWAQHAIQHGPKNPTGEWCAPWDQFATLSTRPAAMRAIQAWEPWHPYAWVLDKAEADRGLAYGQRAYSLSPFNTIIAGEYADRLLRAGRRENARSVALAVAGGGHPVHVLARELLLVQILGSQARFGAALARALEEMRVLPDDAGWARTQRLDLASRALQLAVIVGRDREVADEAVAIFVTAPSPPIDGVYIDVPRWLPTLCARASREVARRCFARLDTLLPNLSGAALASTTAYAAGARRYAEGDLSGAAAAWRPLVGDDDYGDLADAMVVAFAAAKDHDVVARIVEKTADQRLSGASMVMARAAQAAHARGAHAEAARLANAVITAWADTDVDLPVVAELKRLLP